MSGLSTVAEGGVPAARPQFCASSPASRRTAHASGTTAASTSAESVAPASKSSPSTAKTITRVGSRCRARASSIASWSPKAWVDAEPRNRAGSGSLLASNRRIVPGGSPERIVSSSTTASRPCNASSRSFGSHSCSLTSIPVCSPRSCSRRTTSPLAPSSPRSRFPIPITSTGLSGTAMLRGVDVRLRRAEALGTSAPTPRQPTGKEQYGLHNRKNQTRLGSA